MTQGERISALRATPGYSSAKAYYHVAKRTEGMVFGHNVAVCGEEGCAGRGNYSLCPRDDRHEALLVGAIVDEAGDIVLPRGWRR